MDPVARYFPVTDAPLRMRAALKRFGTDFGNGRTDGLYFQVDGERAHYEAKKRAALARSARYLVSDDPAHAAALETVRAWVTDTLAREHPTLEISANAELGDVFARVQEDGAVVRRTGDADALVMVHACFPSGWSPAQIFGGDFSFVHRPVPGFPTADVARSMVQTMVERGPHVRFVWSIHRDAELDHHPDTPRDIPPWPEAGALYLRVERQTTRPFADVDAALFLIRTYLYDVATLSADQVETLCRAVDCMPDDVARYKGLTGDRAVVIEAVRRVGTSRR